MASMGLTLRVRTDFGALACLAGMEERMNEAMRETASDGTDVIEDLAVGYINKRTGRTASTIGSVVELRGDGGTGYVGSNDIIARYLEYGTSPHTIRPSSAGALFFDGTFAAEVQHPGTPAYNWLLRAGEASVGPVLGIAMGHVEAALTC